MSFKAILSMPFNLRGLDKAVIRILEAKCVGAVLAMSPDRGKRWLIIGGAVTHVGAAAAYVYITDKESTQHDWIYQYTAGAAGTFPLFNMQSQAYQGQYTPKIVLDEQQLRMNGANGDTIRVEVIEW